MSGTDPVCKRREYHHVLMSRGLLTWLRDVRICRGTHTDSDHCLCYARFDFRHMLQKIRKVQKEDGKQGSGREGGSDLYNPFAALTENDVRRVDRQCRCTSHMGSVEEWNLFSRF